MGMKVGITGPHGSGKTTILNKLKDLQKTEEILKDYVFLPEMTRVIKDQGFSINEDGDLSTQILILSKHIENILLYNNVNFIVDRVLIDGYVYTKYLSLQNKPSSKVPVWLLDYALNLLETYIDRYTYIFYVPSEFEVAKDGVRSTDTYFHQCICENFESITNKLIKENRARERKIIKVTGSLDNRLDIILRTLKQGG